MLTLNDEQEKALRAWYHMDGGGNSWKPWDSGRGLELAQAIRPLMSSWFVGTRKDGQEISAVLHRDGTYIGVEGLTLKMHTIALAERICRLLNESWK